MHEPHATILHLLAVDHKRQPYRLRRTRHRLSASPTSTGRSCPGDPGVTRVVQAGDLLSFGSRGRESHAGAIIEAGLPPSRPAGATSIRVEPESLGYRCAACVDGFAGCNRY